MGYAGPLLALAKTPVRTLLLPRSSRGRRCSPRSGGRMRVNGATIDELGAKPKAKRWSNAHAPSSASQELDTFSASGRRRWLTIRVRPLNPSARPSRRRGAIRVPSPAAPRGANISLSAISERRGFRLDGDERHGLWHALHRLHHVDRGEAAALVGRIGIGLADDLDDADDLLADIRMIEEACSPFFMSLTCFAVKLRTPVQGSPFAPLSSWCSKEKASGSDFNNQ